MKKLFIGTATTIAVLALSGCSLFYPNWGATSLPTPSQTSSASSSQTPSSSATATATDTPSPTPTELVDADVQIIDASADATAGTITVIAGVTNVSEAGGTCTATLKDAGITKSYPSVKAEANASSTQCFPITIPLSGLASGTAAVQVSYLSASATGKSNFFAVAIP